jgi:hypothetical protein
MSLKVAGVYDGVDLIFYENGGNLEYDFVVAPGVDPAQIQVVFEGMENMRVDDRSGDLVLTVAGGSELRQRRPKVYQQAENQHVEIGGGYRLLGQGRAAFTLAAYDRNRPLVIDPTVDFTTFFGGSSAVNQRRSRWTATGTPTSRVVPIPETFRQPTAQNSKIVRSSALVVFAAQGPMFSWRS